MTFKNQKLQKEFQEQFQERLKRQIRERRKQKGLRQLDVADKLGISLDTYQHWEKNSQPLTNISDILSVLRVLEFPIAEIIDLLGFPPLTSSEIKDVCQDEETLKRIQGNTIYSAVRKECPNMDDLTLGKLLSLLSDENLNRVKSRQGNP